MQKQFCRKRHGRKTRGGETQAESIHSKEDSNFMKFYICFNPHLAHECPNVVALDLKKEDGRDSPNQPDSLHFLGAF